MIVEDPDGVGAPDPLLARAAAIAAPPVAPASPGAAAPGPDPAAPGQGLPAGVDLAAVQHQLTRYLDTVLMIMGQVLPFIPQRYAPEVRQEIAKCIVDLMVDYKADMAMLNGRIALWGNLAAVVGFPALACYGDYKKLSESAKAQPAGAAPGAAAPGAPGA